MPSRVGHHSSERGGGGGGGHGGGGGGGGREREIETDLDLLTYSIGMLCFTNALVLFHY
jgi:hypothetical protein